ncbi:DUF4192 domain-containing protein [Demequina sp. NBRC 110055]|uniref:DUF4192 domain-containing protein n=1 Tax=Demequina sp. NBRC 110055 TaxID=1570344 RepID=UPI000A05B340|nr:DUF4192 domain-containing protein [Demequina sp. NBRC 110055]
MNSTTIHGPGELIASLPVLLGAAPRDAVIVIGTGHADELLTAVSIPRVDLCVPELSPETAPTLARDLVDAGVLRAAVVSWSDLEPGSACPALSELLPVLECAGVDVMAWVTDGATYWGEECGDVGCCPPHGRPVPTRPVVVERRARALARHTPTSRPAVPSETKKRAARAADRWRRHQEMERDEWCQRAWGFVQASMATDVSAPQWGKAIASLDDVRVRDALIVRWLGASPTVVRDVLQGRQSRAVHRVMDGALRPGSTAVPDDDVIDAARQWCVEATAHARRRDRAPLYALAAVLAWWQADLVTSRECAHEALACDPGYTLAMLLREMCEMGLGPGWQRELPDDW